MSENYVELSVGDTAPKLEFILKSCENQPILAEEISEVNLFLSRVGCGATGEPVNAGHTLLTVVDADLSQYRYQLLETDTEVAGTYFGDIQITYVDGTKETSHHPIRLNVRERS